MDLYILDDGLRRVSVVDDFTSLIWTERFNSLGDFELVTKSTATSRSLFKPDVMLAINASKRFMVVKTVENKIDSDGQLTLTVTGKSGECLLADRVAKESLSDLTVSPKWTLSGTPGEIARYLFQQICVLGILDTQDIIPFVVSGNLFPADTIAEPSGDIVVELEPQSLLEAIENLCTTYELGYRLVLDSSNATLRFNIYSGVDRTSLQSSVVPLLFSPELDNLQNQTEYSNAEEEKNVAYVFSNFGTGVVFADGVDPTIAGFKRKVLMVNASDISETTLDVPFAIVQIGKEALANTKRTKLFDGEVAPFEGLIYGTDYNLGDVVEIRSTDDEVTYKRVTEYIFSSDAEGDRAYPTLSQGWDTSAETWLSILETNSWEGYDAEVWDDFG